MVLLELHDVRLGTFISQIFLCCMPCLGCYYRGKIRDRFGISIDASWRGDFFAWLFCCCFASAQEAKHVDDVCRSSYVQMEVQMQELHRRAEMDKKAREDAEQRKVEQRAEHQMEMKKNRTSGRVSITDTSKSTRTTRALTGQDDAERALPRRPTITATLAHGPAAKAKPKAKAIPKMPVCPLLGPPVVGRPCVMDGLEFEADQV